MCGIAGYLGPNTDSNMEHVRDMISCIQSRGPDSQQTKQISENCILGSARLRITDFENPESDMPFYSGDQRYVITYNGEVYNYRDLKSELEQEFQFRTNSDTEILLAAYQKWGEECLYKINGMFSFCIYDTLSDQAFFAIDPAGQKPLYYMQHEDGIYFSSDMEALVKIPNLPKSWDTKGLAQAIGIMFIFDDRTHIEQIKKMPSGCFGSWSKQAPTLQVSRYFKLDIHSNEELSDHEISHLKEEIYETTKQCCFSTFNLEVPYAHLLSGGIDSSSIIAFAKQAKLDLSTYSIGLKAPENTSDIAYNEFEYSQLVSEHYSTNHKQIELTPAHYCDNLVKWSQVCSEPHGAPEAASLYALFENIHQDGFKVAFGGNGPDEIFDGYGHGNLLKDTNFNDIASTYFQTFNGTGGIDFRSLMPDLNPEAAFSEAIQPFLDLYKGQTDSAQITCALNFHTIYPVCELKQIDQTSMAHSIEVRSPFVELELVNLAFRTPSYLKHYQGCEKWIFKEALRDTLPNVIIDRKKAGFPISKTVYQTPEFEALIETIFEKGSALEELGILNISELKKVWEQDAAKRTIFYRLFILEQLLARHKNYM